MPTPISVAKRYIGKAEVPIGSNSGAFVRACQRYTWLAGTGWPWCVAFVQRCFAESGRKLPWGTAGAYDLYARGKAAGWAKKTPKANDIAVWNVGAGHASIVERYDPVSGNVITIDGNSIDQVRRCLRHISHARGFIRVPVKAKPQPKAKKPKAEVVTSASGSEVVVYSSRLRKILAATGIGNFTQPANQDRQKVYPPLPIEPSTHPPNQDRKK
jgi:uncharacterized protein (TIGR02594 family)